MRRQLWTILGTISWLLYRVLWLFWPAVVIYKSVCGFVKVGWAAVQHSRLIERLGNIPFITKVVEITPKTRALVLWMPDLPADETNMLHMREAIESVIKETSGVSIPIIFMCGDDNVESMEGTLYASIKGKEVQGP